MQSEGKGRQGLCASSATCLACRSKHLAPQVSTPTPHPVHPARPPHPRVYNKFHLAIFALLAICLGAGAAFGLVSACGVKWNLTIQVTPFLLLGLGMDDTFGEAPRIWIGWRNVCGVHACWACLCSAPQVRSSKGKPPVAAHAARGGKGGASRARPNLIICAALPPPCSNPPRPSKPPPQACLTHPACAVIIGSYFQQSRSLSVEERITRTLAHAGTSITVTSVGAEQLRHWSGFLGFWGLGPT